MPVIGRWKKGRITVSMIEGSFEGKKTYSYTLQKQVFKNNKWDKSDFLSITDLQDIQSIAQRITSDYVKKEKVEPKPEPKEEAGYQDETVPF